MKLEPYYRKVFFYETDQMGIVHHSNVIRWFEEARFDLLDQLGYGSGFLEEEGLGSPVLDVACQYKTMVRFNDELTIRIGVKSNSSARLTFNYLVLHGDKIAASGETTHCFINKAGKIISLKRQYPMLYQTLEQLKEENK